MDKENIKINSRSERIFYSLGSIALVILGLIYFESLIKPFVVAILLWFMIDQLKEALGKVQIKGKSLPAWLRSLLAFMIIMIISYLASELLISNLEEMAVLMPEAMSNLNRYMQEASGLLRDPKYAAYLQKSLNSIDFTAVAGSILNSFSAIFANLIIILVYVPILMFSGIEGKTFKPMAINVIIAMAASIFVAFLLMPVLSYFFVDGAITHEKHRLFAAIANPHRSWC